MKYIDSYNIASINKSIALLYRKHSQLKTLNLLDRMVAISELFLGRPYILGAAGEGYDGDFDQAPLYRIDGFDCVTYVNTVIALALSNNVVSFRKNLIQIGYRNAELSYAHRHHFMSVDWNDCNQSMGLVKDITPAIVDEAGQPLMQVAEALIDRPGWFRHRTYEDIRLLKEVSREDESNLLKAMHNLSQNVKAQQSRLPYLSLSDMFDGNASPRMNVFQQIPQGAIVEIVRPNWDIKDKIGTNLNISHVGFAIKKNDQLFYRQASSIEKCVCDVSLVEYLQSRLESPSIKGINVQSLLQ